MSNAQRYRNRFAEAREQDQMRDEYHRMEDRVAELEDERDYLRDALTEAIEELDALVRPEHMSATKAQQHTDWMAWLRSALPKEAGE